MAATPLHRLTTAASLLDVHVGPGTPAGLRGVSLEITSGTLTVVRGRPAAQVGTLLAALSGKVPLTSGRVEVAGEPVPSAGHGRPLAPGSWRRRLGVVAADPTLFPYLTVEGSLALPARWNGAGRARQQVDRLCGRLRLDRVRARYPHELSRAERQVVALGMALAYDPDLLVLDGQDGLGDPSPPRPDPDPVVDLVVDLVRLEGRTIVTSLATAATVAAADRVLDLVHGTVRGAVPS